MKAVSSNEHVKHYYNYKVDSYESKYRDGLITHLHTGLFTEPDLKISYSLEEIQSLLITGQKKLTEKIISFLPAESQRILDLGAGHGGTTFTIGQNQNSKIDALTISDRQAGLIKERAVELGLEEQISVICSDILVHDFENTLYGAILGVESFCQIGDMLSLAEVVAQVLAPGGILIISDYYTNNTDFKKHFDRHWQCDVKPFEELFQALNQAGIKVQAEIDCTLEQAPFWFFSARHSELKLKIVSEENERRRLKSSQVFHEYMYKSFREQRGIYKILVAQKQ